MKKIQILYLSVLLLTGIFAAKTVSAQMYWNQAASFAGNSTSYVSVPSSPSLDITGSFTIEAWINPSSVTGIAKGIISKGGLLGTSLRYGLRISNGRILLLTNGAERLVTRSSNLISTNVWTHVTAVYNSSVNEFKIYINGALDTTSVVAGAAPVSNSDSLFIGISGSTTPFPGMMDEVRIWNKNLSVLQVIAFMKSGIGLSGDFDSDNLVLSIPFQNNTGSGVLFTAMDYSDNSNNGQARNVTGIDLKDRPSGLNHYNDCVFFPGNGILSAQDNPSISPTNKMTIEFWLYPKSDNYGLLFKGSYSSFIPDYGMKVSSGKLNAYINNNLITTNDSVKKEKWSHIAFTYFGTTGRYEFYINGKRKTTGNISPVNINDGPDSLAIGAFPFTTNFSGYLDEFRITHDLKTINEINSKMFTTINESNDNYAVLNAVYNLDGSTLPSTAGGPRLNLRGNVSFNFNSAFFTGVRLSPVINFSSGQFNKGFYLKMPDKRIPASGFTGTVKDTLEILSSETISDMNIFVALNHNRTANLKLSITSPIGASTELFANTTLLDSNQNLVTIFDSDADSSLISGRYVNFGPRIKPQFDIDAIFGGSNSKGKWILSIIDEGGSDTGLITAWGLQINNSNSVSFTTECTSLVEGFYNATTNTMIADTMRYFLRASVFPYSIVDSSKALMNSDGTGLASFSNAQSQTDYFLVLKHRNSVETWSSVLISFPQLTGQIQYIFSDQITKAFGNNLKQVDASPVRFGIFSGDENQNGVVDLTDVVNVSNAAGSFTTGYTSTDMNGNNITDLSDVVITSNNASAFVAAVTP